MVSKDTPNATGLVVVTNDSGLFSHFSFMILHDTLYCGFVFHSMNTVYFLSCFLKNTDVQTYEKIAGLHTFCSGLGYAAIFFNATINNKYPVYVNVIFSGL